MAHFRKATYIAVAPLVASPLLYALFSGFSMSGCDAYHNEAERLSYKQQQDAAEKRLYPNAGAAGAGGANAYTYIGPGYNPQDPTQCPNNECLPDPGSRVISAEECKQAEEGLEFLPLPIWDFEDERTTGWNDKDKDRIWDRVPDADWDGRTDEEGNLEERYALLGYTYADDTTFNYYPFGWEPPAIADPYNRCERKGNHVFHIAGGPFLEWGGGLGRALRCLNTTSFGSGFAQTMINAWRSSVPGIHPEENTQGTIYCHRGEKGATAKFPAGCDVSENDEVTGGICPKRDREYIKTKKVDPPQDEALLGMAIDLSEWEGISFWARRGPNSQPGLRVLVGDKYTDDDISYLQYMRDPTAPRYCERVFECRCRSASRPCTELTANEAFAINATKNAAHTDLDGSTPGEMNSYDLNPLKPGDKICWDRDSGIAMATRAPNCGQTACEHQSDSAKSLNVSLDPFLRGTTCQEYTFRGSIQTDICYDPDSKIPAQTLGAEASQACGDHWMKSIRIGLDWQFYMVPFTELLQQGWAKRSYKLDLTALTLLRMTWDRGHIDFYIDDVRVYRKKK